LGTSLILVAVALRGTRGSRLTAPLRWMGRHSYELYLSHEFVVMAAVALFARLYPLPHGAKGNAAPHAAIAAFVIAIVLGTLPLGWVLGRYFAEPLNRRLRGARPAPQA
jgi:peptidoglycan/LPS O-acetylase OafA/YrhL